MMLEYEPVLKRPEQRQATGISAQDVQRVLARFVWKCTLRISDAELVGVDPDFTVEDNVVPLDGADVLDQVRVEREVRLCSETGDFPRVLGKAGLPLSRVNPLQARRFAQALGQKAKTDAVDARTLAATGQTLELPQSRPPSQW